MDNFLMRQQWNDQLSDPQSVIRNNARLMLDSQNYRNTDQGVIKLNDEPLMTTLRSTTNPAMHEYIANMPPGSIQYEQRLIPMYSGNYQRNQYDSYGNNFQRNVVAENTYNNRLLAQRKSRRGLQDNLPDVSARRCCLYQWQSDTRDIAFHTNLQRQFRNEGRSSGYKWEGKMPVATTSKYTLDVGNQFQHGRQTDVMQGIVSSPGNSSMYMVRTGHGQQQRQLNLRQTSLLQHEGFGPRHQSNDDHNPWDVQSEIVMTENKPLNPAPKTLPKSSFKPYAKETRQATNEVITGSDGMGRGSPSVVPSKDAQPDSAQVNQRARADRFKAANAIGLRVFIGNVEKVMKWYKTIHAFEMDCLYEVIGKCMGVRRGRDSECQLLVRDASGNGPVLQIVFWEIDFLMSDVSGQVVRVIGKMIGSNKLHGYKVRKIFGTEVSSLPRLSAISQHIITKVVKESKK